jgi:hypothetical protein
MHKTLYDRLMHRWQCMKDRRESFEDQWREQAAYVMPRAYRWLDEHWSKRGNKASKKIVDPEATIALRAMEASFSSNITPTNRPWKKPTVRGPLADNYNVKTYLEQVNDIMDIHILSSNFYSEAGKVYSQCGLFGTAAMLIEEDEEEDFRCETLPIGSFWLGVDSKRRVNQFARILDMTLAQAEEEFGSANLTDQQRSAIEAGRGYSEEIQALHYIGPAEAADGSFGMKYVSYYIDVSMSKSGGRQSGAAADKYLKRGYYEEFPVVTPRWKVMSDDVYGLECPGMIALGHIKELQHQRKQLAKAAEKQVDPPMQRPETATRKALDMTPGADNIVARGAASEGARPLYQVTFDVGSTLQLIQDLRSQIREVFFYNLFLMVASERRSGTKAREIEELHEEKMLILSTVYEQFSQEFLDPAIERIFKILERRGRMPIPPPEMQGQSFEIEYVSVMAQAMKLVGIGNMDRALAILGQVASIDATVLDIIDLPRFAESYIDRLGVDTRVKTSPEEREARAASRQAAQQQQAMQQQAQVQADTAKVLSDAKTDEDNALTQLMGQTIG